MNTAERLAIELEACVEALRPYIDYCSDTGPNVAMAALTNAETALRVYHDTTRPLEVGDTCRIVASAGWLSDDLQVGDTVVILSETCLGDVKVEAPDCASPRAGVLGWTFPRHTLARIPGGDL